ncbi:MAG: phosphoribosylformylglycinamidine synthase I [Phycisphaerales bacterium]|nr:MAG: phosphoribosylformylglycinamidine synthase I [Phycisphaerales bacterium]
MAANVRVLVLRAAGINCDAETVFAWEQAGADVDLLHINRVMERPQRLRDYGALTIPGGFSYGDDIAAGKVLANQLVHHLGEELRRFVNDGKLVLGTCNGFQVLVKAGLLPGGAGNGDWRGRVTIAFNEQGRFEDRWVYLRAEVSHSPWLDPGEMVRFPIAHAEGRFVADSDETLARLRTEDLVALCYVDAEGNPGAFPVNPNGSDDHIAGLTDPTGRVLGLMPHPERNIHPRHDPLGRGPSGRRIFDRAVAFLRAS